MLLKLLKIYVLSMYLSFQFRDYRDSVYKHIHMSPSSLLLINSFLSVWQPFILRYLILQSSTVWQPFILRYDFTVKHCWYSKRLQKFVWSLDLNAILYMYKSMFWLSLGYISYKMKTYLMSKEILCALRQYFLKKDSSILKTNKSYTITLGFIEK